MKFAIATSDVRTPFRTNRWLWLYIAVFSIIWASTLIGTTDINNWLIENALTFLSITLLISTYKKFRFSDLSYLLICIYLCLHVYGSKYTYAENPFGFWIRDFFEASRNPYDRIVHFCFGFLLAYPMREQFFNWWKYPKRLCWILPIELTLSIGAFYEVIEWAVADIFFTEQGDAYLGIQGDIWDAQKDIFLAFIGAILATIIAYFIERAFRIHEKESS